jgi:hypothetical protein
LLSHECDEEINVIVRKSIIVHWVAVAKNAPADIPIDR